MDHFSERLVALFEELEAVEYDPVQGIQGLMGRLERIFWKIEQEGFPVMDDHRIGVLLRTLPGRAREVVHRIWGDFRCRLTYAELRRQISRHQFPEDLGESDAEPEDDEEDPEMDPDPEMEEDPEPEEVFEIEEDPEPEEVFEMEEDPEPEEVFEMEDDPESEDESEGESEEDSDEDVDIEIVDPDEDPEETVEDPDEVPEIPAPRVPVPLRDDLVMSLQLWMLFLIVWMYTLVGRVAPPN